MPSSMKFKNSAITFERKVNLLNEYRAALQEPIIKVNKGDRQFVEGLEAKIINELTQLIFDFPELKNHPKMPLLIPVRP